MGRNDGDQSKKLSRFFIEKENIKDSAATIFGEDVKHITKVLRLGEGAFVTLCDGYGMDYEAQISKINSDSVELTISNQIKAETESNVNITLYQAIPKAGKSETIIQKCVELGIYKVVFFNSKRCVVKIDKKQEENKLKRYNRVAMEAAKQSKRGIIPQVDGFYDYKKLDFSKHEAVIFAYEEEKETTLKSVLTSLKGKVNDIALIIGPEGGFEAEEANYFITGGAHCVTLGKRILRTETAGMATLAMILYELEG